MARIAEEEIARLKAEVPLERLVGRGGGRVEAARRFRHAVELLRDGHAVGGVEGRPPARSSVTKLASPSDRSAEAFACNAVLFRPVQR